MGLSCTCSDVFANSLDSRTVKGLTNLLVMTNRGTVKFMRILYGVEKWDRCSKTKRQNAKRQILH